ncbi:Fur family transcriptional regulator [Brucella intermedia]|uniref:Fur family transcriptional regulator n=1 Tax=Brucella intermedia TaxID=94625 RepID=UPI002248BBA1|nr:Fur family transcriptional regulator [Brucella intermedia]
MNNHLRQAMHRNTEATAANIRAAETLCLTRGLNLTRTRRLVLEILWRSNQPMGAYDLLRELAERLGRHVSPPTVYRALEFLQKNGFVSKIETKNAFIPRSYAERNQTHFFFICENCGASASIGNEKVEALFAECAASLGFSIGKSVVEMQGCCADCTSTEEAGRN